MKLKQRIAKAFFGAEIKQEVTSSLDLWRSVYGGGASSNSGEVVTWRTALQVSTVLACVQVRANGVAQVPWRLYREVGGSKKPAVDHPLYALLNRRPNPWQTSFEFRETLMYHLQLCGNAFVFVNRVGRARDVRELIPIEPGRVQVEQKDDLSLVYWVVAKNGQRQPFGPDAIWHIRGASWNSWIGLESVRLAREAIGLSISLERGHATFQKNGAKVSGVLAVDGTLSPEKFKELSTWLDKHELGGERENKPLIADMSAKWQSMTMSGVDAQHLETRKHQIEEICRNLDTYPQMIGHAGDSSPTFASAEQFFLAHVVHKLMPTYARIEQSADVNLLSEEDRAGGLYTKFIANGLMRGAAKDRAEYYAKGLGSGGTKGWLTQNDVRGFEEMDLSDDPKADELPQPTAKQPAPAPTDTPPEPIEDDPK